MGTNNLLYEIQDNCNCHLRKECDTYFIESYFKFFANNYFLIVFSGRIRECVEPTTIGGFDFAVGDCFQPAVYAVHHDPQHWGPEPVDKFVPERQVFSCSVA